ncbi:restriction endonuclease [Lysinibacillus fusiformis]|uniref:restriction endonuclease n=1 Tax=Lysinibacillus fusiformis TaxID=28031 RepID=UPI001E40A668|nr:restriction endonuclease [Lysinibacillus fusiformis]MCE4045582.1 restriction endonuclease [Lysinibacillus fusiformis]
MLDFKELSKDGTDLERLAREIFTREGFETHWTGKGPDGGRDLIVIEKVKGPMSNFERKWLVQCKHKAISGQSVGKDEANSLITDCERIGATGYLLICTTALSSGLIQAYEEIKQRKSWSIDYWDEVKLEDKLLKPCNFPLIHQFFPISSHRVGWRIHNTNSPSFWAANYKRVFIYLSSRLNMHFSSVKDIEKIYETIEIFKPDIKRISIQLRAVYFDDKYSNYLVFVDFIVDKSVLKDEDRSFFEKSELDEIAEGMEVHLPYCIEVERNEEMIGAIPVQWDIKGYVEEMSHDGFDPHGKEYYIPYMENFKSGIPRR